jgi:hypothetical protein
MLFVTGMTPPTIMRSMWLNVRLTSSGMKIPDTWYWSRSVWLVALPTKEGWLACRVSNFIAWLSP